MASGDHFELILKGQTLGEPTRNVLHFLQTAGAGGSTELATAFDLAIESDWEALFTPSTSMTFAECINLDDDTDFDEIALSWLGTNGAGTATTMAPWVCVTFKKIRASRAFRSGYIRFSGLNEDSYDGVTPGAGTLTLLNTLGTALSGPFSDGGGNSWDMVIRSLPGIKYPTLRYGGITAVEYSHVGSQVSRKTL